MIDSRLEFLSKKEKQKVEKFTDKWVNHISGQSHILGEGDDLLGRRHETEDMQYAPRDEPNQILFGDSLITSSDQIARQPHDSMGLEDAIQLLQSSSHNSKRPKPARKSKLAKSATPKVDVSGQG